MSYERRGRKTWVQTLSRMTGPAERLVVQNQLIALAKYLPHFKTIQG